MKMKSHYCLSLLTAAASIMLSPLPVLAAGFDQLCDVYTPMEMGFSSVIEDTELDTYRGEFAPSSLMFSNMSAFLEGNQATNTVSGANNISEGALNNVTGVTALIQNSGSNVIIQQALQFNVNFQ